MIFGVFLSLFLNLRCLSITASHVNAFMCHSQNNKITFFNIECEITGIRLHSDFVHYVLFLSLSPQACTCLTCHYDFINKTNFPLISSHQLHKLEVDSYRADRQRPVRSSLLSMDCVAADNVKDKLKDVSEEYSDLKHRCLDRRAFFSIL